MNAEQLEAMFDGCGLDTFDGAVMQLRITDDAAFADIRAFELELRLDQDEEVCAGARDGDHGGQDFGDGYEREIHCYKINSIGNLFGLEISNVAFEGDHARVFGELPVELGDVDVDGVDARGAVLQEAIGEAAGGAARVEADFVFGREMEIGECAFELQTAATRVAKRFSGERDFRIGRNERACFACRLAVDEDISGEKHGLSALAGRRQSALDEEHIEARFVGMRGHGVTRGGR